MVPSARLELAQLSPLPPQDSVSTNFTTTALFTFLPEQTREKPLILTPKNTLPNAQTRFLRVFTCQEFEKQAIRLD